MCRKLLTTFATGIIAALGLSGCVESQAPLVANGSHLLGQQDEVWGVVPSR